MVPAMLRAFRRLIREEWRPALDPAARPRILEVGAMPKVTMLSMPELAGCERVGIDLECEGEGEGWRVLRMNANRMDFDDASFDAVISNAMLEHDPRFWLSAGEMRRVLRPGGFMAVGVPGVVNPFPRTRRLIRKVPLVGDVGRWAPTLATHMNPHDFYRFTKHSMREIILEGLDRVAVRSLLLGTRILGWGWKPS